MPGFAPAGGFSFSGEDAPGITPGGKNHIPFSLFPPPHPVSQKCDENTPERERGPQPHALNKEVPV
jgi:hypothetical protein